MMTSAAHPAVHAPGTSLASGMHESVHAGTGAYSDTRDMERAIQAAVDMSTQASTCSHQTVPNTDSRFGQVSGGSHDQWTCQTSLSRDGFLEDGSTDNTPVRNAANATMYDAAPQDIIEHHHPSMHTGYNQGFNQPFVGIDTESHGWTQLLLTQHSQHSHETAKNHGQHLRYSAQMHGNDHEVDSVSSMLNQQGALGDASDHPHMPFSVQQSPQGHALPSAPYATDTLKHVSAPASTDPPNLLHDLNPDQFARVQMYMAKMGIGNASSSPHESEIQARSDLHSMADATTVESMSRREGRRRGERSATPVRHGAATAAGVMQSSGSIRKSRSSSRPRRSLSQQGRDLSRSQSRSRTDDGTKDKDMGLSDSDFDEERLKDSMNFVPPQTGDVPSVEVASPKSTQVGASSPSGKGTWREYGVWAVKLHKATVYEQLKTARHTAAYPLITGPRESDALQSGSQSTIKPPPHIRDFCEQWYLRTSENTNEGKVKRQKINWNVVLHNTSIAGVSDPADANPKYFGKKPTLYCGKYNGPAGATCRVKIEEKSSEVRDHPELVQITYTYYERVTDHRC